jgi:murein DD-endopeptidase MepM/ murein hydrolase activator NlpD
VICCLVYGASLAEDASGKSAFHETLIRIKAEKEGNATHLYVENLQSAEVTVTLEMELTNLESTVALPYTTTLSGKKRVKLLTLWPKDAARGWSWSYTYYSTFGSTSAQHDDSYIYSLPYGAGKSYRISQGYNGEYSHFGADQYAIDWRMPQGTPVHAARGGIVVGLKKDSDIGGDDSKYDWDANYVLVQHSDSTLGQYVHLLKGGTTVRIGQQVEAGDLVGYSGNTGHSTGPHLHFSVFKARDGKHRETIPVRYKTADNLSATLEEGKSYKAPGSPALATASRSKGAQLAVLAPKPNKEPDALAVSSNAVGH